MLYPIVANMKSSRHIVKLICEYNEVKRFKLNCSICLLTWWSKYDLPYIHDTFDTATGRTFDFDVEKKKYTNEWTKNRWHQCINKNVKRNFKVNVINFVDEFTAVFLPKLTNQTANIYFIKMVFYERMKLIGVA